MQAPPKLPPADDREALIREARSRQRRRQLLFAAGAAVAAAVGLSLWAAIPGRDDHAHGGGGGGASASRGSGNAGRVPIAEVGTSGGVTWAINGIGMWLTTDGGRTWRRSLPPHVAAVGDVIARVPQVQFVDRRHGWLLAVDVRGGLQPGRRRHAELDWTSDGGRTWHWTMPRGCCGPFSFVNRRLGFFAGEKHLFETRNGGATWRPVSGTYYGGNPTFVDARHGVALLDGGLLSTADGGREWKDVRPSGRPAAAGDATIVEAPVSVVGGRLVVTAQKAKADVLRLVPYLSDGGARWIARPFPGWWTSYVGSDDGSRLSAATPDVWFAAARDELAVTTDAGRTWRRVRPVNVPHRWVIGALDFTSARTGWAIFDGPRQSVLMRTTDGGVHWTPAGPRRARHARNG
jgi:photosystem II stability/assembly factor-like uncharacterized protein